MITHHNRAYLHEIKGTVCYYFLFSELENQHRPGHFLVILDHVELDMLT